MNLFQVKQNQIVKIIDLKKGNQYSHTTDPILEGTVANRDLSR